MLVYAVLLLSAEARGAFAEPQVSPAATSAPVVVDGRVLFYVAGVSAAPASQRAQVFAQRIRELAADKAFLAGQLTLRDQDNHTDIIAGQTLLVSVYDADARLEGVARGPLAEAIRHRITGAVRAYQQERSPQYLRRNGLFALTALIVLSLALFVLRRLLRAAAAGLEHRYRGKEDRLRISTFQIMRPEQLWHAVQRLATGLWSLTLLVSVLLYLGLVLDRFPWTRFAARRLLDLVLGPLTIMGRGLADAVPGIVFIVILVLILRYALKITRLLFLGLSAGAVTLPGFDPDWAMPTYGLVRIVIVALGIVVAYPYVPGSDSDAFKGVSIFIGVLFSLGSSSSIANFVAGYMLIYRRAFKPGGRVKIGSVTGDILVRRLQATHLRTLKNEEVIFPNSMILASEVINYSSFARSGALILHTTVGIGYETPWRQVEAMLLLAASRTPGLRRDPSPYVRQTGLGDFCVTHELNAYCGDAQTMDAVYTAMHRQILDVFNEYGVQIMTPAYERDPEQPKIVPKDQWYAAPAQVSRQPVERQDR